MNPLQKMFSGSIAKSLVADLGIDDDTPETQAAIMSMIGENILSRVTLEILKMIPADKHHVFEALITKGDIEGLRDFLVPYVPDLDTLISEEAKKEYEATKSLAAPKGI